MAYFIARKINRFGTKGNNFYSAVVNDSLFDDLQIDLSDSFKKDVLIDINKIEIIYMLASEIVNAHIPILKPTDSTARALAIMQDYKISHLAVVSKNKLQGLISEEAILSSAKLSTRL